MYGIGRPLPAYFRVLLAVIVVEERNMTGNAQTVGENTNLGGVAKMTVDVLLAGVGVGFGLVGKQTVDALVRVKGRIVLCEFLGFLQFSAHKLRIVFRNGKFDAGRVID